MKAVETMGTIDDPYHLHVDHPLPLFSMIAVNIKIL